MLATVRKMIRDRVKAKRKAEWKDYGAYKAQCRQDGLTVMSFEDWKAPKKEGSE
jgi:hypothetical protein